MQKLNGSPDIKSSHSSDKDQPDTNNSFSRTGGGKGKGLSDSEDYNMKEQSQKMQSREQTEAMQIDEELKQPNLQTQNSIQMTLAQTR